MSTQNTDSPSAIDENAECQYQGKMEHKLRELGKKLDEMNKTRRRCQVYGRDSALPSRYPTEEQGAWM
jgi:hypothetical protein